MYTYILCIKKNNVVMIIKVYIVHYKISINNTITLVGISTNNFC